MPQGHSHTTAEQKLLLLNEEGFPAQLSPLGASSKNIVSLRARCFERRGKAPSCCINIQDRKCCRNPRMQRHGAIQRIFSGLLRRPSLLAKTSQSGLLRRPSLLATTVTVRHCEARRAVAIQSILIGCASSQRQSLARLLHQSCLIAKTGSDWIEVTKNQADTAICNRHFIDYLCYMNFYGA